MRVITLLSLLVLGLLTGCMPEGISAPLDNMSSRPTPLEFGLYVTPDPAQNPIDPPERFTGFHSALDFEILPGEEERDVPVYAVCTGRIVHQDWVEGYGGTIVQQCTWEGETVTVLYGHLSTESFTKKKGNRVQHGTQLASLAPAKSNDSGDTRKHLHLGIHKGKELEFRGYVQDEKELEAFINPLSILNK